MQETREELRQRSSEGLRRTMSELMESAKALEDQQRKLNEQLRGEEAKPQENSDSQSPTSTLRSKSELDGNRPNPKEWVSQREQLQRVLEKVQETVTESEASEPLLAEALYETYREAKQSGLEQRMELVPKLVERGLEGPARDASGEALQSIEKLAERIEASATSVLGSEEESLRRALRELDKARDWIESERQAKSPEAGSRTQTESDRADAEARDRAPSNATGDRPSGNRSEPNQQEEAIGWLPSEPTNAGRKGESEGDRTPDDSPAQQTGQNSPTETQDAKAQREGPPSGRSRGQGSTPSDETSGGAADPDATGARGRRENATAGERSGPRGSGVGNSLMDRIANEQEFVAPLTGDDFNRWSDALRDVEELVRDPELRAEANRIREAAREMRVEYKRHAKDPQWPLVQRLIAEPMERLRERVSEELIRKSAKQNEIVPIDRDPVPNAFQERLNQYYERLGSGKAR